MSTNRTPQAGIWYHNLTGKVFKVCVVCYKHGSRWRVILENEHGARGAVTIDDWNLLDLETECEIRRRNAKQ